MGGNYIFARHSPQRPLAPRIMCVNNWHVDRQASQAGFFVLGLHIHPSLSHGLDDAVQGDSVVPSPYSTASLAALMALMAPIVLRSMHGICTKPATGSHVIPKLCSIPISAAFSICAGVPFITEASPAAAIEQATPTSPGSPFLLRRAMHCVYRACQRHLRSIETDEHRPDRRRA